MEKKEPKEKISKKKPVGKIRALKGENNVLIIAPHGVYGNDDFTNIIAEELNEKFKCYSVINEKYRRPETEKGELSNSKKLILDLNIIEDAKLAEENEFLKNIDDYAAEIIENGQKPLVLYIHGIDHENIEKVTNLPEVKEEHPEEAKDLHILVGYGQWQDPKSASLTAKKETVDSVINSLTEKTLNTIPAPLRPIKVEKENKLYCGNDKKRMNQYFKNKGVEVQSLQLEIRNKILRDNSEKARETAQLIGDAITPFIIPHKEAEQKERWTALSKEGVLKTIKVKEIDLTDRTFESRSAEYGTDEDAFENLVQDIRQKGILQNVIVRGKPGSHNYQLISGFRRLTALERICKEDGREESFEEESVPARVFESMPDENAFQVSFSENLARKDLTLWEIANFSRVTKEHLQKQGWEEGQINEHLADLLKKDARTVRRYLKASTIKNEEIRRDLHSGKLDITTALIFMREEIEEENVAALYAFFKQNPAPSREIERRVQNLVRLEKWSQMSIDGILAIPTSADFLSIDADELKETVEYLQSTGNKAVAYILRHQVKDLKRPIDAVKSNEHFALFSEGFSKKSKPLEKKMTEVFKSKKVSGDLKIEPGRDVEKKIVKLTVSAPATDIPKMMKLTAKELKDDFASLEKLFQKIPNPPTQDVRKEKVEIDKNATTAFTIPLRELQSVLKTLNKEGAPGDDSKAQILVRTLPNNKVQFGCVNKNGLLIEKEMKVHRKGSVGLMFSDICSPIINLRSGRNTECVVTGIGKPPELKGEEGVLTIRLKDSTNFKLNAPTYSSNELIKYYDEHLPPKPLFRIDASELKSALNKVLGNIDRWEVRKAITGIFFKIDTKNLTVTGTNAVKLFEIVKHHSELRGKERELILSFDTGKLLKEILQKETGDMRVGVLKNNIYFQADKLLVVGKLIENEKYPDYGKMFTEADNSFRISIAKLREMSSAMNTIADPEDNHRISIKSENGLIVFQNEKGTTECHAENVKGRIDWGVSAKFLKELAKIMDGDDVEVRHRTDTRYLTFHPDQNNQRALLTTLKKRSDSNQPDTEAKKVNPSGAREWAVYSVNCCNGCSHDCVYCYGKSMANKRVKKGHIPLDHWKDEKVRQKDVEKGYQKREGRIMFPSVHDITPNNFEACYTVLEKLLRAGNEVLVVSKPHFECIKPICDNLAKYRENILYRFTIGAKNDEILSIWEPNAPKYEERKRCLKYAFDSGYNTSVSVEPMLDSEHIDSLIEDLSPLVNDAIWIGKMNHIGTIISNNGDLKEQIKRIKENQTDDKIKAIFKRHKENPKIKWKESIKKVVGLPLAEKPGLDI